MNKINIQVSRETHRKLAEIGRKGQSYNDIVEELLLFYMEHHQK